MSFKQFIEEVYNKTKNSIDIKLPEIEIRFRDVDKNKFLDLKKNLTKKINILNIENITQTDFEYNLDDIVLDKKLLLDKNSKIRIEKYKDNYLIIHKSNIFYLIDQKKDIKYNLAYEYLLEGDIKKNSKPLSIRKKDRTSFFTQYIRCDFTIINEDIYEVEIEIINPDIFKKPKIIENINNLIIYFYKNLKTNNLFYFINLALSNNKSTKRDDIDFKYVSKLRDCKIRDLNTSLLNKYCVSPKADGDNYYLVFKEGINLIYTNNKQININDKVINKLDNSIFVGEYIEKLKLFLLYDCILYKGKNIINCNYLSRRKYLFNEKLSNLEIRIKDILILKNFYIEMNLMLDRKFDYPVDGMVLTPIYSPHRPNGLNENLKNRITNAFNDVLKIKPLNKISIDLLILDNNLYATLTNYDDINGNYTTIEYKDLKLININYFIKDFKFINDNIYDNYTVIEFIYKDSNFIDYRIRSEKIFPNKVSQILDILELIRIPLLETTIRGLDTVLMRKNNNRIKKNLFNEHAINSIVLDIGSGNGGDIDKWTVAKAVIAIEPNKKFIKTFKERLSIKNNLVQNKIYILNTFAEETNKILTFMKKSLKNINVQNSNLVISFMISLTFFFENSEKLNQLANTINVISNYFIETYNNSVKIIFYTLEGYKIKDFFKILNKTLLELNTIKMILVDDKVEINISDSKTVENQTEYLVDLEKFFDLINFKLVEKKDVDVSNILMSDSEKIYSSFHTYGFAIKK